MTGIGKEYRRGEINGKTFKQEWIRWWERRGVSRHGPLPEEDPQEAATNAERIAVLESVVAQLRAEIEALATGE